MKYYDNNNLVIQNFVVNEIYEYDCICVEVSYLDCVETRVCYKSVRSGRVLVCLGSVGGAGASRSEGPRCQRPDLPIKLWN